MLTLVMLSIVISLLSAHKIALVIRERDKQFKLFLYRNEVPHGEEIQAFDTYIGSLIAWFVIGVFAFIACMIKMFA